VRPRVCFTGLALIMESNPSTVICWVLEDRTGVVTANRGEDEILIVFRDPRQGRDFQERTAAEGCKLIGMSLEALRALLNKYDLGWVAVPDFRTRGHMVDLFTAKVFIEMLAEDLEK
jgi:hypothetical protein